MLQLSIENGIARVTMNRAPLNALNADLITQLSSRINELGADRGCRALILDSSVEGFFSNGLDPEAMLALSIPDRAEMFRRFLSLSRDLYVFPKLTLSAIAGHAMAGGAVLGIVTDFRFLAEGRYSYCFSEVKVGLTIPDFLLDLISGVTGPRYVRDLAMLGERYRPEECLQIGLADRVVAADRLIEESRKFLMSLLDLPASSVRSIKHAIHAPVVQKMNPFLSARETEFFQFLGENFEEGLRAVLERRKPRFNQEL